MKTTVEITPEDTQHYLELEYALLQSVNDYFLGKKDNVIAFGSKTYETLFFPKGLSAEDTFATVLIEMYHSGKGLTTKHLIEWFGWTRYKCYKLARNCKYCHTITLICEEGGYGGTGWMLLPDMNDAMIRMAEEKYPCRECKQLNPINPDVQHRGKPFIGNCRIPPCLKVHDDSGCSNGKFEKRERKSEFYF